MVGSILSLSNQNKVKHVVGLRKPTRKARHNVLGVSLLDDARLGKNVRKPISGSKCLDHNGQASQGTVDGLQMLTHRGSQVNRGMLATVGIAIILVVKLEVVSHSHCTVGRWPYQIRIRVRINQHQHKGAAGRRLLEGTQLLANHLGLLLCHPSSNAFPLEVSTGVSIQPTQLRHSVFESLLEVSQCHTFAIGLMLESCLHPSQILLALVLKLVHVETELYRNAVHCEKFWERGLGLRVVSKAQGTKTQRESGPRTSTTIGEQQRKTQVENKRTKRLFISIFGSEKLSVLRACAAFAREAPVCLDQVVVNLAFLNWEPDVVPHGRQPL